jgi:hypothetical protein
MKSPTAEIRERLEKNYASYEKALENLTQIILDHNLVAWAEDIGQDPEASDDDIDFAEGVLEIADTLAL